MPKKVQRKLPNQEALQRALEDHESTPELDQCIADTVRKQRESAEGMAEFMAAISKTMPPEPEAQFLKHKAPTHHAGTFAQESFSLGQLFGLEPKPPPRECLSELKAASGRLVELREIQWADVKFWKLVAAGASAEELAAYIRNHYRLDFPAWPAVVWRQMVHHPQKREKLFGLHKYHIDFDEQCDVDALRDLRKNLPRELTGQLLWQYLRSPGISHLHLLASQELEPSTLGYLRKALRKLVKDTEWCQEHPGVIPPEIAPNPRHAPKDVVCARAVEQFVERLLNDSTLSNGDLAKLPVGGTYGARLKWAAQARDLVQYREHAAVERYSEQRDGHTIGRKPRQSRKAARSR